MVLSKSEVLKRLIEYSQKTGEIEIKLRDVFIAEPFKEAVSQLAAEGKLIWKETITGGTVVISPKNS